jgi:hypothetical protein
VLPLTRWHARIKHNAVASVDRKTNGPKLCGGRVWAQRGGLPTAWMCWGSGETAGPRWRPVNKTELSHDQPRAFPPVE